MTAHQERLTQHHPTQNPAYTLTHITHQQSNSFYHLDQLWQDHDISKLWRALQGNVYSRNKCLIDRNSQTSRFGNVVCPEHSCGNWGSIDCSALTHRDGRGERGSTDLNLSLPLVRFPEQSSVPLPNRISLFRSKGSLG